MGQLVAENGLDSFDRDTLLGALLEVKEKSGHADNLESWRERAKLALEKNIPNEVPVIVTFLTPPNKDVRAILKNSGLKWNPFRQEWQGFSNPTSLREALNTTDAGIQEIAIG